MVEEYYNFTLKGLLNECEEAFSELWNAHKIDRSIISCFKGKNPLDLISPMIPPITYELVSDNSFLDDIKISSYILSNNFFSFLLTQCMRNNMLLIIPIKGLKIDEIKCCEYFNMLPHIFENVWFSGHGEDWISESLIVSQPYKNIISQFSHLYRIGGNIE